MANNETSIIISAVDKTQGALNSVNSNLSSLEGQFSKLTGVVSGFAALAGVTAFAGIVKGAVDSAAGLHDMAQQTGASVESLSAMRAAAKLAGVDMEQVAGGLGKLSKNMLAAAQGSGDAANVFKALGVSVTDSSGKMKSSDAVFLEFSKGLQTVGSTAERAAAAQLVLGKSGATLLPMMNDLAVSGELQAKITAKQAAAADDLQDNMTRLATVGQAWKTTVAMEMVPAANAFVEALLEVSTTTDMSKKAAKDLAADGSIKEWAINSARAVGFVVDAFDGAARTVKGIGILIAAAAAQTAMVAKGDFAGALSVDWRKDLSDLAGQEQFSDVLARKLANIGTEAPKAAEGTRSLAGALNSLAKEGVKALQAALNPLETQAQNLEREVANYGLAESAIQGTIIARMEAARAMAAENGAWPEHLNYLNQEIAARKRIASASSQKDFLDTNKKAAEQSAKEWEKFSDDINRALTDALMRGFEDGKSFGQNFVDSLKNSLKTAALKIVVNYVMNSSGSLVASAANAVLGTSFNASSSSGANGSNLLGTASNLNSAYNLYNGNYLAAAQGAYSYGSTALGYTYGTNALSQQSLMLASQDAGVSAAASSGSSTAGLSASSVGWVAAIVMGMYMSSQAWKAGTRWDGYYNATSNPIEAGPSGPHHQRQDQVARTLFGDSFADSEFFAVMSGNALSQQVHNMVWGGAAKPTGISSVRGTFSEAAQGFNGQAGQEYRKAGGWFGSASNSVEWQGIGNEFQRMMSGMYLSVRDTLLTAGELFEDNSLLDKIRNFTYTINEANTNNMQGSFAAWTEQVAQELGAIMFPSVGGLVKAGETMWSQVFARVLQEADAVGKVFDYMGKSLSGVFGKNNADGILRASDHIVQLFGSIDALNESFTAYYSNFYTQSEQVGKAWAELNKRFSALGVSAPKTREEFRGLVDSLDLSTDAGQRAFAGLMSLQGAFASLTPSIDDVAAAAAALVKANRETQAQQISKALEGKRNAQIKTVQESISAAQASADAAQAMALSFGQIIESLSSYRNGLSGGDLSTLSPAAKYAEAKRLYETTTAQAGLGDLAAIGNLQTVADAFLQAAKETGTSSSYARDLGGVIGSVDSIIAVAGRQIPIAETALKVAQDQLVTLNDMLTKMSGGQETLVVSNYQQAAADWASFFSTTALGDVVQNAAGTMQRISDSMGLFVDKSGTGYTFSASDSPYALAGASAAWRQEMLSRYGQWSVPAFASGGRHFGGLRLVGENGPELEYTGPSNIINSGNALAMLGNGSTMIDELKMLRTEVEMLREEQRAGTATLASNTGRTLRTLEKFDIDGMPEVRAA
jgi:hypothetical protein